MSEQADRIPSFDAANLSRPLGRRDGLLIVLLMILATGLRSWQINDTEVTARDSHGYIAMAWQLEQKPLAGWGPVLAHAQRHPGYPVLILATSWPVRWVGFGTLADQMQLGAQLASALASVLLVWPMFRLGRELFDRRVGFGAALLLQCLPASGRLFADGLSESTFLLFSVASLLWANRGLQLFRGVAGGENSASPSSLRRAFFLAGAFGGLAYLTRPEGALIVVASSLILLIGGLTTWRPEWKKLTTCCACLVGSAVVLGGPYVGVTGRLTVKPSAAGIFKSAQVELRGDTSNLRLDARRPTAELAAIVTAGPLFADWWADQDELDHASWAWRTLGCQLLKGFHYVGWPLALLGLWWYRGRLQKSPGQWALLVLAGMIAALGWRVAVCCGYLSERHLMLLILAGSYWTVAGLLVVGEWLERLIALPLAKHGWAWCLLLLAFAGSGLPKTMERLHAHRTGFREAGLWLAEHAAPGDAIEDPFGWACYYAGRMFQHENEPGPTSHSSVCYLVVEGSPEHHRHLADQTRDLQKVEHGAMVFSSHHHNGRQTGEVRIYAVPCLP